MKKIAFDLDGTLITCRSRQVALYRSILAAHSIELEPETFWKLKRSGYSTFEAGVEMGLSSELSGRITKQWTDDIENPYWLAYDSMFDDVVPVLSGLREVSIPFFLLTARRNRFSLSIQLRRFGLCSRRVSIFPVDPREAAKQKASILREHRVTLYIGDTESDALAARVAGVRFAGLDRGQRDREYLSRHNVGVYENLAEALQMA